MRQPCGGGEGRPQRWAWPLGPGGRRSCGGGGGAGCDAACLLSRLPSGQKYLTQVVKVLGPLSRNYYVRAVLHLG